MNAIEINPSYLMFQSPFNMIISGPSKAGKTHWCAKLIKFSDKIISPKPDKIFWYYSEYQPFYANILAINPSINFVQGLPDLNVLKNDVNTNKLAIFDDLMLESSKDPSLNVLFSKGGHHWNVSSVFITQNLYFNNSRCARLNSHYLVLFRTPDKMQINCLSKQLYPGKSRILIDVLTDLSGEKKYEPLIVDLTVDTPDEYRLRSNVFPGQNSIIYKPK